MGSDGDGVGDNADEFPDDADESLDTDGDGVGDNADAFPEDPERTESASALTALADNTGLSAGVVLLILILIGAVIASPLVWFFCFRKGGNTVEITESTEERSE